MADTLTAPTAPPPPDEPRGPSEPYGPRKKSPRVRKAWRVLGAAYAVVTLVLGVGQAVAQIAHEERTIVREFDATDVRSIEVDNPAGRVRVVGDETRTDGITVTARLSDGLRHTGHSERLDGDRLVLATTCPIMFSSFCMVDYTIETPPGLDVNVRSETGSSIEGIDGAVTVSSDQTAIELTDVSGPLTIDNDQGSVLASGLRSQQVKVSTDQGDVRLRFTEPPRSVEADAEQGTVEIVVPDDDEAYRLTTEIDQGTVERDIRTDPEAARSITATTDQGNVVIRYP
jgi:hypothetical protein